MIEHKVKLTNAFLLFLTLFLVAFRNASSNKVEARLSSRCGRDNFDLGKDPEYRDEKEIFDRVKSVGEARRERGSLVKERASIKVWGTRRGEEK